MDFLKKLGIPLIALVFTFTLGMFAIGCGGGRSAPGTNTISGTAAKGALSGSTVNIFGYGAGGTASIPLGSATTATDGSYSLSFSSTYTGPVTVEITGGTFVDELTGSTIPLTGSLKSLSVVPSVTSGQINEITVNPNIVTTIATDIFNAKGVINEAEVKAAGTVALSALGLPTTDASNNVIDPSKLDLTDATNADNAELLVISAALSDTATTSGVAVTTLAQKLATDITNGDLLGTAAGVTATIDASITKVNTDIALGSNSQIVANLTSVGGTADITKLTTAVTDVTADVQTTLKGFALSGNTFSATTGNQVWTVGTTGAASSVAGATAATATNVAITGTLADYTGAPNPKSTPATFSFYIASTGDSRKISGTLSPVTVAVDSAGEVTVSVPVGAVLTFSGTTSAGTTVSGTATNLGADTIVTTTSGVFTINASNLLTTITNKVGNADLNVLQTAGTFNFEFGFSGIEIGHENTGATGLDKLFPLGTNVTGRAISGQIVTQ